MRDITPGEWQVDSNGRRYRWDGRCREYEMMVETTNGMMLESVLEKKIAAAKSIEEKIKLQVKPDTSILCPFREMRKCQEKCAFYHDGGCAVGTVGNDTIDKVCPFSNNICSKNCGLYDNGCRILKNKENLT